MLGPIFGSLHLSGSHNERRELFLDSARWGIAFALPTMMMLALLGDSVLALWMGDKYVYPGLMMLLAGGLFLSACQGAAFQALIGMNAHGRVAIFNIVLTVATLVVGSLIMQFFEWTLTKAAILICCAFWIGTGWPDGASAPMMAAVACSFFAAQDEPARFIRSFGLWSLVAIVVVAIYLFALVPAISHLEVLVVALALSLLLARPILIASPAVAIVTAAAVLAAVGSGLLGSRLDHGSGGSAALGLAAEEAENLSDD